MLFKIAAVLWILWGLVHILAGVMTISAVIANDMSTAVSNIADAVDPASVKMEYPSAATAIVGQHGFNLFWIGCVTFICAFFVWRGNKNAIYLAAITGGLADLGYFLFLDLGGHVHFMPGTLMTIFSASAIVLSIVGLNRHKVVTS